jgi:hypothetical protein
MTSNRGQAPFARSLAEGIRAWPHGYAIRASFAKIHRLTPQMMMN